MNGAYERTVIQESFGVLVGSIQRCVDLTSQRPLGLVHQRSQLPQRHITDDHQIDVAVRSLPTLGETSIDVGQFDPAPHGLKHFAKNHGQTKRLANKGSYLIIDRAVGVESVDDLVAELLCHQQAGIPQGVQFSLQMTAVHTGDPLQLPKMKAIRCFGELLENTSARSRE